jgi:hypothetical protein
MNREILNRQMFGGGGAAFPDLSGDGKVTQKDILMGRGVVPMAGGGNVQYYENGGQTSFIPTAEGIAKQIALAFKMGGPQAGAQMRDRAIEMGADPSIANELFDSMMLSTSGALKNNPRFALSDMDAVESVLPKGDDMVSPDEMQRMQDAKFAKIRAQQAAMYDENSASNPTRYDGQAGQNEAIERALREAAASENYAYGGMVDPRMRQPVGMAEGGMMVDEGIGALPMGQGMDGPEVAMEQTLGAAAEGIGALDASQDYEQAINSVRGDQLPMEARYEELASFVGPNDAAQTPESVLALVQPVMQMAEVDQGIGSISPEAMGGEAPMTPEMAGGIMSNVPEAPPMDAGPPQPFNQGGAARDINNPVQYYADGGAVQYFSPDNKDRVVKSDPALRAELDKRLGLFQELGLGSDEDRAKSLENQRRMSKSGMLFDIADAALRFAGTPVRPGMSLASTAAESLAASQLFPKISKRADSITELEQKQLSDKRQMNLAALTQAESSLAVKRAATEKKELATLNNAAEFLRLEQKGRAAVDLAGVQQGYLMAQINAKGDIQKQIENIKGNNSDRAITLRKSLEARLAETQNNWTIAASKLDFKREKEKLGLKTTEELKLIEERNKNSMTALDQTYQNRIAELGVVDEFDVKKLAIKNQYDLDKLDLTQQNNLALNTQRAGLETIARKDAQVFTAKEEVLKRAFQKAAAGREEELKLRMQELGFKADEDSEEYNAALQKELKLMGITANINSANFEADLKKELQARGFSQDAIEREIKKTQQVFDNAKTEERLTLDKAALALREKYQLGKLTLDQEIAAMPNFSFEQVEDGNETILMKIDKKTGESSEVLRTTITQEPDYQNITLNGITTPVDVNTQAGQLLIAKVKKAQEAGDRTAKLEKIGTTRKVNPKAYFSDATQEVFMSYDRGETFVKPDGTIVAQGDMRGTVFPLGDEKTYEIHKNSRISARALEKLAKMDTFVLNGLNSTLTTAKLGALSEQDKKSYLEVANNIRKGTGVLSKFAALIDGTIGQLPGMGKFSAKLFKSNTEARQYVRTARITLRAALVNSPRFPVTELNQVQELLADEKAWIVNPYSEVGRMEDLAQVLDQKKRSLLRLVAQGTNDPSATRELNTKIMEIELAEKFLNPLLEISRASGASDVEGLSEDEINALGGLIK